jgi:hypothetical protein
LRNGVLQYKHAVHLRLVSRVYLTRQIEQRRFDAKSGKILIDPIHGSLPAGQLEAGHSIDTGFNEIARRPVVFGYRSIGRELVPAALK